jgi:hypothetical protein
VYDCIALLVRAQKRKKRDYDVKVRVRELKLGDLVYQLDTATVKGKTRKLSPLCFYLRRTLMPLPIAVGIDPSSAIFFQ